MVQPHRLPGARDRAARLRHRRPRRKPPAMPREQFERAGLEPQVERFRSAVSAWHPFALTMALALVAVAVYPLAGRVTAAIALVLITAVVVCALREINLLWNPLRLVLPKRESQNVWAIVPPARGAEAKSRDRRAPGQPPHAAALQVAALAAPDARHRAGRVSGDGRRGGPVRDRPGDAGDGRLPHRGVAGRGTGAGAAAHAPGRTSRPTPTARTTTPPARGCSSRWRRRCATQPLAGDGGLARGDRLRGSGLLRAR